MKITKYAGKNCVKCKLLDKILNHLKLSDIETIFMEDIGEDKLMEMGVMSLPTLIIEKNDNKHILSGTILPQDITDIINE